MLVAFHAVLPLDQSIYCKVAEKDVGTNITEAKMSERPGQEFASSFPALEYYSLLSYLILPIL